MVRLVDATLDLRVVESEFGSLAFSFCERHSTRLFGRSSQISPFNEGKACDAVIRWIERRALSQRAAVRLPEREGHKAPVELVCTIGGQLFAFEHTGIEPFPLQIKIGIDSQRLFGPLESRLVGKLPDTEYFQLIVPVGVTEGLKQVELRKIRDLLAVWIENTAGSLPICRIGRHSTPIMNVEVDGIPFPLSLHRSETIIEAWGGHLKVVHAFGGNLEEKRYERILKAYSNKWGKLAAWKRDYGARTVLILEENDIQLTNHHLVADAVLRIEEATSDKPDEIYLVSSHNQGLWWLTPMRCGEKWFHDYDELEDRFWEVDPSILESITAR